MKFAVIGDIHSNLYALISVLDDIKHNQAEFILCTGDLVGFSPFPNEVIETIRKNDILTVKGDNDKAIGNGDLLCCFNNNDPVLNTLLEKSFTFSDRIINDINHAYLKSLPKEVRIRCEKLEILMVHGSPRKINEYLYEGSKELFEVAYELNEDILICGHTHTPYHIVIHNKHIINSGSVGKPVSGNPNATYVLVDITDKIITSEIRSVHYDFECAAHAIEETNGLPDEFALMLRKGCTYMPKVAS